MPDWLPNLNLNFSNSYSPWEVLVELLLIGLSVHWVASVLHGTRGTRPLRAILVLLVAVTLIVRVLTVRLGWARLEMLYRYFVLGLGIIALVAFQPELRRALFRVGDIRFLRRKDTQSKLIGALVKAAGVLSKNRHGALVAIERKVNLQGWAENGTVVDADASANLLVSIFVPTSPLHDLGVIARGNRITAANCQFPIADGDEVDPTLGSRHLAAVAMSYETDALVLVVSEETGAISLADNGELVRVRSLEDLGEALAERLGAVESPTKRRPASWHKVWWPRIRQGIIVAGLTGVIWYLADQAAQTQIEGAKIELQIEPRSANRLVDIINPSPPLFSVTLRGPTRAISALRSADAEAPLAVKWLLDDDAASSVERTLSARDVLSNAAGIRERGLTVVDTQPRDVVVRTHEKRTLPMPLKATAPGVELADVTFEPAEVQVTLRAGDLQRIPEGERFVSVPLEGRLSGAARDEPITLTNVALSDRVGGVRVSLSPPEVKVTLRVIGARQQKTLSRVYVALLMPPSMQRNYIVEPKDEQEFLLDLVVEGDRAAIASLTSADVQALAQLNSSFENGVGEYRPVEVRLILPRGVSLVGPPRFVEVRLVRREASG